ncbi:MAG TPA: energy transducer TonB [Allosphingosinicella sp.]|jgi:TonB family protein
MPLGPLLALAALGAPPAAPAPAPAESPPPLSCEKGPLRRSFGGTGWLVFGCEDKATLVVAAEEGNPAAPFYFILYPKDGERGIYGEGDGDKKATAPAFEDLQRLGPAALAALLAAAEQAGPAAAPEPARTAVPAIRARAKQPNLFADLDYPPAALRAGEEGTVEYETEVAASGRVERCSVLVPSGSAILDSETCRMIQARARFTPARDSAGRPTSDRVRGRMNWRLPPSARAQ